MHRPRLLILGDANSAEMLPVWETLSQAARDGEIEQIADVASARLLARNAWFADLFVVFQNSPDEFAPADVRRLLALFPLARWVCCYGSWCESDGRTRNIWPPGMRVPSRNAGQRITRELLALRESNFARPVLPWTASLDEVFTYDVSHEMHARGTGEAIRINTADGALWSYLRELLIAQGYRVLSDSESGEQGVVWDVDPLSDRVFDDVREYRRSRHAGAVVALSGLAHPEDIGRLNECGADATVDKFSAHSALPQALATALACKRTQLRVG